MRVSEQNLKEQILRRMLALGGSTRPWGDTIGLTLVVTVTYILAARMSLILLKPEGVAVMWPALGLAVGGLIALGSSVRVPVAVGVCTGIIATRLVAGGNAWLAFALGLCNIGGALLTADLIERWFGPAFKLENVASVLGFLGATVVGTVVAAVGGSAVITIVQPTADILSVWHGWFTSAALGIITVAPLPIGLASAMREAPPRREQIEGAAALVILGVMGAFVISLPPGPWATAVPVALVFPLVLWIAVRCRPVFAAAAAFIIALAVVCSTSFGLGHFGEASISLADRTLAAQTIVLAGALCVIILSALFAELREKEIALKNSNQRLQLVLAEREEAERALADRNAQLALSGKIALVGSYAYNANETSMRISSGYAAIHGLPEGAAEVPRHAWRMRVHPDDIACLDGERREAFRERRRERILEYRIIRSGGEVRWIESRSFISYESDGRLQRVVGINIDVTQRKRAEGVLKESEARLRDALAAGQVIAFDWDAFTGFSQRSDNASQILGIEPKHDPKGVSNTFLAQVHPDDRLRFKGHIWGVDRDNPSYSCTFRFIRPDGQQVWLEEMGSAEFDAAGRLSRIKGLTRDITERKRAEEHQRTMNAELDHRVKNVLATVSVVTSQTRDASRSMEEFVTAFEGRIRSMATAHELLSIRQWQGMPLVEVVRRELAAYAASNNTELDGPELMLSPEAGPAMAMVVHELVTNAAKYGALSTQSGRVSVRWHQKLNGSAQFILVWQETGGPRVEAPQKFGYGTSVIRELIPYELGGLVDLTFAPKGVLCRLEVPLDRLTRDSRNGSRAEMLPNTDQPSSILSR
jgi:PAS domain S-box-containing protein